MTTIAYRDGVMASDTRAYSGGAMPIGAKAKCRRVGHVGALGALCLVGASSNVVGLVDTFLDWTEEGRPDEHALFERFDKEDFKHLSTLTVFRDGEAVYTDQDPRVYSCIQVHKPEGMGFAAIGSGAFYALGAMAHGATAEEAARIGGNLDIWSGGDLTVVRFEEEKDAG